MVHFPAARDGFLQKESPMANYVFLAVDLKDSQILRLEQSHLVDVVLCTPGSVGRVRKVTKVSDEELRTIVEREISANDIKPGDRVSVDTGTWMGMYGIAVDVFGTRVKVYIELHSRRRLITLDREDLTPIRD